MPWQERPGRGDAGQRGHQVCPVGPHPACVSQCKGLAGPRPSPHPGPSIHLGLPPTGGRVEGWTGQVRGWGSRCGLGAPGASASGWGAGTWRWCLPGGAICSDNWCWSAFTQQPVCLGRQRWGNTALRLGPRGVGVLRGARPPRLPGKSFRRSDPDPSCCGFSRRTLLFSASPSRLPRSGAAYAGPSAFSALPCTHPENQVQISLSRVERAGWAHSSPGLRWV